MTRERDDEQFADQAKRHFDASVERIDSATLSRLNRGRHAALAELDSRGTASRWASWLPACVRRPR